jgi:glycosyltransferase involved in cell wall biosynthesis
MNVLFLMFVFPDMNKSFNMYTALAEEFQRHSHNVTVIAPAEKGAKTSVKSENGLKVLRVRTLPLKNVPAVLKGFSNILLPWQYSKAIEKYHSEAHYDLIVMPTPPITLARLAGKLKKKHNAPVYLILRDIFPQNAVDLGFFRKGGLIHRYFRNKEKKLYRLADRIGCMSPANIKYIINNNPGLGSSRLHELKNFQILYEQEGSQKQELRGKYDLENMFVVVFGGNMGKPQQLENVIELASRCMKYEDVLFLLLGEGIMVDRLRNTIREKGVSNIRIINTIPKREYQDLLSICDVGLISLNERFTIPNIPSKTLDYFNVGLPVLASIDRATDYNVILDEAGAGLWSYAGNHDALMRNFESLYNDPELRRRMAQNGRDYFIRNLTPDIAYNTIINSLN